MGRLRGAAPGFRKGRCYVAASNFRCACNAAVRPSQLQPLTMSTMLGRPVVTPLRASSRFWTRNLLMSESGTSTRLPPPFCHLTSPDWTVRGPHRGVAPPLLHSAPKPSSTGTSRFTLPLLLLPPRLCTLSLQSPLRPLCAMDSAQLSLQGIFFYQSLSVAKRGLLPKHPVAPSTPLQNPRQPCRGRSLALPLWRPRWRGGQHHSRSVQPNLMRYSAPEKGRAAQPTCGEERSTPASNSDEYCPKCIVDCAVSTTALGRPHRLNCNLPWALGPAEHVECSVVVFDPCPFRTHNQDIGMYPCKPEPT